MQKRPEAIAVTPLAHGQLDAAATALADAFQDDPLMSYIVPDPAERADKLAASMLLGLHCGRAFGVVHTTEGSPLGATIWFPPGRWEMSEEDLLDAGLEDLGPSIGQQAVERLTGVETYLSALHRRDITDPHWFLAMLGVRRAHQGRGIGGALLRPMLDRADKEGVPCYLETEQPRNIPFYARLGFQVVASGAEPASKLAFWTMKRPPAGGRRP